MRTSVCVVTRRGQVSVPAEMRARMGILPGQKLAWERVSEQELRVTVVGKGKRAKGPMGVVGAARMCGGLRARTTKQWMALVRAGER